MATPNVAGIRHNPWCDATRLCPPFVDSAVVLVGCTLNGNVSYRFSSRVNSRYLYILPWASNRSYSARDVSRRHSTRGHTDDPAPVQHVKEEDEKEISSIVLSPMQRKAFKYYVSRLDGRRLLVGLAVSSSRRWLYALEAAFTQQVLPIPTSLAVSLTLL